MDNNTKKKTKRKMQKLEKTIFSVGLIAIIFVVATYAWFIGLSQVAVSNFEIEVKSSDGLTLSLDATNFSTSLNISVTDVTSSLLATYSTHKNRWVTNEGLVPVSSVGTLDNQNSVLDLFSKTSITSINGGYKLRTNLIDNDTEETGDYVVFDLFIKNTSGTGYTPAFNAADDEGIYLTQDSSVSLTSSGTGGDGIENSLRVGFMQIGRIDYTAENAATLAQSISCQEATGITPLCNAGTDENTTGRGITWNIWEPNDTKHTQASVEHFTKVCKKRTAANTYDGACDAFTTTDYVATYAVNAQITSEDNVNIYDGLNTYETLTNIEEFTYFTDTDKDDPEGKEIFYLAPNSITKIRVYIWLEGQDVDNYDLGSIGKKIVVNFGFTKNKYSVEDEDEGGGE